MPFTQSMVHRRQKENSLEATQVFREPVITPSGLSYEQSALQEHLSKVSAPLLLCAHCLAWLH